MVESSESGDTESVAAPAAETGSEQVHRGQNVVTRDHDQSERSSSADGERPAGSRIAFFTPELELGGAQRVTVTIANSLAKRGWDVDVVAGHLDGEFVSALDSAVTTVDLDIPRVPGLGIFAGIPRLVSYLNEHEPAVLFPNRTHANLAAIVASRLSDADVYVASTEHSAIDRDGSWESRLARLLAAFGYRYADDVIAVSEGVAENVVENTHIPSTKTTVLNNPIDIEDILAKASAPVDHEWLDNPEIETIVSVGRLKPIKDYGTLLDAFAALNKHRPETRLILVGKGPEQDRLEAKARELGVEDYVSFPGYTDNPYVYMKHASVFVLSSKEEGLPTALIEALACGCTVVSTDCEYGPREILVDGEYGRLTPVGDASELANAIEASLEAPMPPERSRQRAHFFSMEAGADRYEEYIRRAIANR